MLTTSHQYAGQNRVGFCTAFRAIATIRFPDDHTWPQLAFSQVIGGVQIIYIEEAQQMWAMFSQSSGETEIIPVFQVVSSGDQGIQLRFQSLGTLSEAGWIQAGLLCLQLEGGLQQGGSIPGKVYCPAGFARFHPFQVLQQVREAFLFEPVCQPFIILGSEAVRRKNAFKFLAQDLDHHITAAIVPNGVNRDLLIGEHPQKG